MIVSDIVANDNESGSTKAFYIQLSIYCYQFEDIFKISNKLYIYNIYKLYICYIYKLYISYIYIMMREGFMEK